MNEYDANGTPTNGWLAACTLGCAIVLVGISTTSGSALPLVAAGGTALYAVFVPLRLTHFVCRRPFIASLTRLFLHLLIAGAALACSVLAINSGIKPLTIVGTLAFAATIGVGVMLCAAMLIRSVPRLWPRSLSVSDAVEQWRVFLMVSSMRRQDS